MKPVCGQQLKEKHWQQPKDPFSWFIVFITKLILIVWLNKYISYTQSIVIIMIMIAIVMNRSTCWRPVAYWTWPYAYLLCTLHYEWMNEWKCTLDRTTSQSRSSSYSFVQYLICAGLFSSTGWFDNMSNIAIDWFAAVKRITLWTIFKWCLTAIAFDTSTKSHFINFRRIFPKIESIDANRVTAADLCRIVDIKKKWMMRNPASV